MNVDYQTKILQWGSATIIVHRPELSLTEYRKREDRAKAALESYGRAKISQIANK